MFRREDEAIAGARASVGIGDSFVPAHGTGPDADEDAHGSLSYTVVGRIPETGSPWDRAILVPVESVWSVHGLANGHGSGWTGRLGPPFEAEVFPGTPAILVVTQEAWANVALRSEFSTDETMAFLPGAVLASLHALMGDIRQAMSVLAIVTQVLVALSVLAGLLILYRLLSQPLAVLRALGAPNRFGLAIMWSFAATLIISGAMVGLGLGVLSAEAISRVVAARTEISISATLSWPEIHLVAAFVSISSVLALIPAAAINRRSVIQDLRR